MKACARTRELEERADKAESLLLEAAWAFRHLGVGGDQQREAYAVAVALQDFETHWHERRRAARALPACLASGGLIVSGHPRTG